MIGANYSPEPTGNAPYTSSLSRALKQRGIGVRVITTFPHYPEWRIREGYGGSSRRELVDGVDVLRLRHYVPSSPSPVRRLLAELSFGVRSAATRWPQADVVLLVSPSLFAAAVAMSRVQIGRAFRGRSGRGVVLWTQDLYSLGVTETGTASGRLARAVHQVESWVVRKADGVVAIHDRFAEHLRSALGAVPDRVTTVRNWTHLRSRPAPDVAATRRSLGWADGETIVLHAGNQGAKQGLENVVEAARRVDARGERVRFVLLGDGSRRRALEESARGVRAIQFVDPLDDEQFPAALAAADILLVNELAGLAEMSVPSKLTSYFDAARPVLAATSSSSTTAHEIAASGGGVRVDAENPDALVDAAVELGNDVEHARALGLAGNRYRHEVLSEDAAVTRFHDWLARHADRPRGRPGASRVAANEPTT